MKHKTLNKNNLFDFGRNTKKHYYNNETLPRNRFKMVMQNALTYFFMPTGVINAFNLIRITRYINLNYLWDMKHFENTQQTIHKTRINFFAQLNKKEF